MSALLGAAFGAVPHAANHASPLDLGRGARRRAACGGGYLACVGHTNRTLYTQPIRQCVCAACQSTTMREPRGQLLNSAPRLSYILAAIHFGHADKDDIHKAGRSRDDSDDDIERSFTDRSFQLISFA